MSHQTSNSLAIRGAIGFGAAAFVAFGVPAWYAIHTAQPGNGTSWFLPASFLCGIVGGLTLGGLTLGRRWGLAIVLGISFFLIEAMFMLEEGHSVLLSNVVWTGLTSAFMFWVAGGCAALTLPAHLRFDGARALAIPGGIAGVMFQFFYGPGRSLLDLGSKSWWGDSIWEHMVLWVIAGAGGGWLFGKHLSVQAEHTGPEQMHRKSGWAYRWTNGWAVASIVCGAAGLGIGAFFFLRSGLPLGLTAGLTASAAADDWLWSWGLVVTTLGIFAILQLMRRGRSQSGAACTLGGLIFAIVLFSLSDRVAADPWKSRFNTTYANNLLQQHAAQNDPDYGYAIYTGNLILAQAALDNNDIQSASRYLVAAADSPGVQSVRDSGPDTTVAAALLQRGGRDSVTEYLRRMKGLWPDGGPVIDRWLTTIRAGRRPNFNNRNAPVVQRAVISQ